MIAPWPPTKPLLAQTRDSSCLAYAYVSATHRSAIGGGIVKSKNNPSPIFEILLMPTEMYRLECGFGGTLEDAEAVMYL